MSIRVRLPKGDEFRLFEKYSNKYNHGYVGPFPTSNEIDLQSNILPTYKLTSYVNCLIVTIDICNCYLQQYQEYALIMPLDVSDIFNNIKSMVL